MSDQVECDNCGCEQFIVYRRNSTVYIECDGCGATVLVARAEA